FFATGIDESFTAANADLFKRFKTVGDKRWARDCDLLYPACGQTPQHIFRGRSYPLSATQARLKRNCVRVIIQLRLPRDGICGEEALGTITVPIQFSELFAAIIRAQTVPRIQFREMSLW